MIYLEPRSVLDNCILKIDHSNQIIYYSYTKLIESFDSGMTYIDSIEHIEYNIIGYSMKSWPVVIDDWTIGDDAHDNDIKLDL